MMYEMNGYKWLYTTNRLIAMWCHPAIAGHSAIMLTLFIISMKKVGVCIHIIAHFEHMVSATILVMCFTLLSPYASEPKEYTLLIILSWCAENLKEKKKWKINRQKWLISSHLDETFFWTKSSAWYNPCHHHRAVGLEWQRISGKHLDEFVYKDVDGFPFYRAHSKHWGALFLYKSIFNVYARAEGDRSARLRLLCNVLSNLCVKREGRQFCTATASHCAIRPMKVSYSLCFSVKCFSFFLYRVCTIFMFWIFLFIPDVDGFHWAGLIMEREKEEERKSHLDRFAPFRSLSPVLKRSLRLASI